MSKPSQLRSTPRITRVLIKGLHGTSRTLDVRIEDNTLILVGENGSGKTTFLRTLYYCLSGNWTALGLMQFEHIAVYIDDEPLDIRPKAKFKNSNILDRLPQAIIDEITRTFQFPRSVDIARLERQLIRYGLSYREIVKDFETKSPQPESDQFEKVFRSRRGFNVLHLPTYRRIERELGSILENVDIDEYRRVTPTRKLQGRPTADIELVEFGMSDVERLIETHIGSLRENHRISLNRLSQDFLSEIISKKYDASAKHLPQNELQINSMLERLGDLVPPDVLGELRSEITAQKRSKPSEHSLIVIHYFNKLAEVREGFAKQGQNLVNLCKLCNEYIPRKNFIYDDRTFEFQIKDVGEHDRNAHLKLADLSSGEKQVVSLFAHLYLSHNQSHFVIIDEPELSLSVRWQKRFLVDIISSTRCSGLIAATHSPFTYDNELVQYARGIGEFYNEG